MADDPLERSVLSHMNSQFIVEFDSTNAADVAKQTKAKKSETIIVKNKNEEYVGFITDSDILDKIVIKGEDSYQVPLKNIMFYPIITISAKSSVRQARINET